jgi:putative flippase GtrA
MSVALSLPHPAHPARLVGAVWPHTPSRALISQFARFSGVGTAATGLPVGLYLPLRVEVGPLTANLLAMAVSTLASIEANRRLTFRRHGGRGVVRQYVGSVAVFLLGVLLASGTLGLLGALAPGAGRGAELVMLLAADAVVGLFRFVVLRGWVFPADLGGR